MAPNMVDPATAHVGSIVKYLDMGKCKHHIPGNICKTDVVDQSM